MKLIYKIIFIILINSSCFAQQFSSEIAELNNIGKSIISDISDAQKLEANEKFKTELKKVVENPSSFNYNFDSLQTISILQSEAIKIYNWAVPLSEGNYLYFAYLQIKQGKDSYKTIELIDKSESLTKVENKILTPKTWYGALYYKVIENKKIGKNTYTLLGWDGNNMLTNKKIIDVITVDSKGYVKIGAPIFKTKRKTKKRMIFEYSENAVMSLKFHKNSNQIIFDFLVPTSSKLKGIYEYYGPALNRFDALKADKKKWVYQEDIDIELDKSIKDFIWNDPKEE